MSDEQVQLRALMDEWNLCKAQDDQKKTLISNLFIHVDDLLNKLSVAESELRDKKDVIKLIRSDLDTAHQAVGNLKRERAQQAHVLVLVDGDHMLFKDELVKQGMEGGQKTAGLIKQAVKQELNDTSSTGELHVFVRVYANMEGLARTYRDMGILSEAAPLGDFVRGFNMVDPLFDYVDAGSGRECADEKIKAIFRLHLVNVHCQRILFGGTADSGYARILLPCVGDEAVCRRITLLEGPPFAHELADIKDRFRTVLFDKVFRSQKLQSIKRKVSFRITPPATPLADYAAAAAKAPGMQTPSPTLQQCATVTRGAGLVVMLKNKAGQRVDARLEYSQADFHDMKALKLCNHFHLTGKCPYMDNHGHCQHLHDDKLNLTPQKLRALQAVARWSPCRHGLYCNDLDCFQGHCCPQKTCKRVDCRFPVEMHSVDTNVVG